VWQINVADKSFTILCKTFEGLEEVLAAEVKSLGFSPEILKRAVQFNANFNDVINLNLRLRTALNVMIKLAEFTADNPEKLYRQSLLVNWPALFNCKNTFSVSHTIRSPFFQHSQFAALKLKDAIVDRFRSDTHNRPSVERESADVVVHLHISHERVSIWCDTSGKPLYIRGYKKVNGPAPLNEVLAAGLIKLSGWNEKQSVFNPMCGGGTLGFEAYMMACKIAPSFNREKFAYHALPWYNHENETRIQQEINSEVIDPGDFMLYFSDVDERAIDAVKKNARSFYQAGKPCMEFHSQDFFNSNPPNGIPLILMNPPYGERMDPGDLIGFYKKIGNTFKHKYAGHTAWIISSALQEIKHLGLRPSRKIRVFNGPLEARWLEFKMYGFNEK
jgi:putative N6-adenine-specific DNA methylase